MTVSLYKKGRVVGYWFKYFQNPLLILLTRLGWIKVAYCSYHIRKEQCVYEMLGRPVSNAGGDLMVLREVLIEETYKSILELLPPRPIRIVDVGANIGAFTIWLHRQCGVLEGFLFEPDLDSFSICQFNLNQNGCDDIRLDRQAIGGITREAEMWVNSAQPARSSLCRQSLNGRTQKTHVISLSDWLKTVPGDLDLLKLDCEGSEWEILDAGAKAFSRFGLVVAEVHRDLSGKHDIGDFPASLTKHGFTTLRWDARSNGLYIGRRDSCSATDSTLANVYTS
jgi:FkbM family methyltransferase